MKLYTTPKYGSQIYMFLKPSLLNKRVQTDTGRSEASGVHGTSSTPTKIAKEEKHFIKEETKEIIDACELHFRTERRNNTMGKSVYGGSVSVWPATGRP
jgi:hypothetical protein